MISEMKREGCGNILVVDGCSEDRTVEVARLSPREFFTRITVISYNAPKLSIDPC